jgi:integrase
MPARLTKRNGTWHFVRKVPKEFAHLDRRGVVRLSTEIRVADDRAGAKASRVADRLSLDLEASWRAKAGGQAAQAILDLDEAKRRARALELDYKPIEAVAADTAMEIMRRVDLLAQGHRRHDPTTAAAVFGGVPLPEIKLSSLYAEFEGARRTLIAKMSPGQFKKWKNGKTRAIELLIEVIGDRVINRMTRNDALRYVEHWEKRVAEGEVVAETANRNLTHITGMLSAVSRRHRLMLEPVFAGTRLEGDRARPRPPFTPAFIVNRILAPGALDGMNEEERAAVHVLINTGARPSEIINLRRERILLEAEIPHIQVRPDDRVLKTDWSYRDIPLVGIALDAMRKFPDGFPRYYDKGDSFSAAVNKFLEDHGLRETERHTLYSLRHGFKDRLREVETPDELKDELMGHDPRKPQYGDGHGLRLKLKYVSAIALRPGMQIAAPLELVRARASGVIPG